MDLLFRKFIYQENQEENYSSVDFDSNLGSQHIFQNETLPDAIKTCHSFASPEEKHLKRWKMHIYTTGAILREIWRFSFPIQLNVLT